MQAQIEERDLEIERSKMQLLCLEEKNRELGARAKDAEKLCHNFENEIGHQKEALEREKEARLKVKEIVLLS